MAETSEKFWDLLSDGELKVAGYVEQCFEATRVDMLQTKLTMVTKSDDATSQTVRAHLAALAGSAPAWLASDIVAEMQALAVLLNPTPHSVPDIESALGFAQGRTGSFTQVLGHWPLGKQILEHAQSVKDTKAPLRTDLLTDPAGPNCPRLRSRLFLSAEAASGPAAREPLAQSFAPCHGRVSFSQCLLSLAWGGVGGGGGGG